MKTALLFAMLTWFQPGPLEEGRCSQCKRFGMTSTVTMEPFGTCTLMGCDPGHYDETGKFIPGVPCNSCYSHGRCSRGHYVYSSWKGR